MRRVKYLKTRILIHVSQNVSTCMGAFRASRAEKIGGGIPGDPRPAYATSVIIFIRQRTVKIEQPRNDSGAYIT